MVRTSSITFVCLAGCITFLCGKYLDKHNTKWLEPHSNCPSRWNRTSTISITVGVTHYWCKSVCWIIFVLVKPILIVSVRITPTVLLSFPPVSALKLPSKKIRFVRCFSRLVLLKFSYHFPFRIPKHYFLGLVARHPWHVQLYDSLIDKFLYV